MLVKRCATSSRESLSLIRSRSWCCSWRTRLAFTTESNLGPLAGGVELGSRTGGVELGNRAGSVELGSPPGGMALENRAVFVMSKSVVCLQTAGKAVSDEPRFPPLRIALLQRDASF